MSRSLRALDSSIHVLKLGNASVQASQMPSASKTSRRCLHSSRSRLVTAPECSFSQHILTRSTRLSHSVAAQQYLDVSDDTMIHGSEGAEEGRPSERNDTRYADHLDDVFAPLKFPPELARRLMTHGSHKAAVDGHNGRFSFIGRRVLEAYLLLFLHSSSATQNSEHDFEQIVSTALNTYTLGENVAPTWHLGRLLRWVPTVPANYSPKVSRKKDAKSHGKGVEEDGTLIKGPYGVDFGPEILRSVGLYKVHGEAVQAVVGGVYHQFGGSIAHRLFHTRVLPHILLPGRPQGLHDSFHEDALHLLKRLGGPNSNLAEEMKAQSIARTDKDSRPVESSIL